MNFGSRNKLVKRTKNSKAQLEDLQIQLDTLDNIELDIDKNKKLSKETFRQLKKLVKNITLSQEEYAEKFGKTSLYKVTLLKGKKE